MDQVNPGESSGGPSVQPVKRRRGRPRKHPSQKPTEIAHLPPGFEGAKEHLAPKADATAASENMVGQAVTGVVEAAFDAGYLLRVRIGDTDTNLRGVIFKPGHYIPVTADNDVAPHLPMIKRNDVPIPSKRKYTPSKPAAAVPPVGARGNLVPVVLQAVNNPNELPASNQLPSDASRNAHAIDDGDLDVHMVEPISMLPPDHSIPVSQFFVAPKPQFSPQAAQGVVNNGSIGEGTSEVGHIEKSKSMTSADDTSGSSQTSDMKIDDGKGALKPSSENSVVVPNQEIGNNNEAFSTESLPTASAPKPFSSYPTGRMTELLQAVQENLKENLVQIAEQPISTPLGEPAISAHEVNHQETMAAAGTESKEDVSHDTSAA